MLLGKNETIAQPGRVSHKPNRGIGYPGYLPTRHFIYTHECMVKTQENKTKNQTDTTSVLVHRTKEQALVTSHGVISWPLTDKADLFNATMDRITQPRKQAF